MEDGDGVPSPDEDSLGRPEQPGNHVRLMPSLRDWGWWLRNWVVVVWRLKWGDLAFRGGADLGDYCGADFSRLGWLVEMGQEESA
jgi:hypothetical protein